MLKIVWMVIWDKYQKYKLKLIKGLKLKGNVYIHGVPIINISKDASIVIGNKVTLNSRNEGYQCTLL